MTGVFCFNRKYHSMLSWKKAFYTFLMYIFISTNVSIFQSWIKSRPYDDTNEVWKTSPSVILYEDFDSKLLLYDYQRIVHIADSVTNVDHCVFYNFLKSANAELTNYEPITLALHSTVNYAEHVIKHADNWDDVVSYAIFLFPKHDEALQALAMLHKCHNTLNQKVSIHLVWNRSILVERCIDDDIVKDIVTIPDMVGSCTDFDFVSVIAKLNGVKVPFGSYPINVMRNEARRGAATKLHIIGDIETQFSPAFAVNVRPLAQQLLNGYFDKAVLVYRRFEIDENEIFPTSLQRFSNLLANKKIVPFNVKHSRDSHFIPNLQQWLTYSLNNKVLTFDNVSYTSNKWEPQFLMRYDAPYHYEHVPTRMTDHQLLCYELCRAGYSYLLMSHVYNIHPVTGNYRTMELSLGSYGKTKPNAQMRKFRVYINAHYSHSAARCHNWNPYF